MACWTSDHRRRPHDHCLSSSLSCTVFCRFWCSGTVACSERRFLFSFNLTCFTVMDCFHVCIFCINVSRWEMPQTDEAASSLYGPAKFGSEIRKADPEMSRLKPLKQMFNPRGVFVPEKHPAHQQPAEPNETAFINAVLSWKRAPGHKRTDGSSRSMAWTRAGRSAAALPQTPGGRARAPAAGRGRASAG